MGVVPQSGQAAGVGSQRYERFASASEGFLSVALMLVCAFYLAAAEHFCAVAAVRIVAAGGVAVRYRVSVAGPPEWVVRLD